MANKIILGQRPKTYKPTLVTFPLPDGSEGGIEATFTYRTRTEFGQLLDTLFNAAGSKPDDFSMADAMVKTRDTNADYLGKILTAWNLDEPLNAESLKQLCDEIPAAAVALMTAYREVVIEGRLGN
jgi:hypothetical protein